jgi:hypothetical protein
MSNFPFKGLGVLTEVMYEIHFKETEDKVWGLLDSQGVLGGLSPHFVKRENFQNSVLQM